MTTDIEAPKRWTESNPDQVTSYPKAIAAARQYVQDPANADDVATRTSEVSGESPPHRRHDRAFADPGRILYGSDFPYASAERSQAFTASLNAYPAIDHDAVNYENASTLFPRFAPAAVR